MTFLHLPAVLDEVAELARPFADAGHRLYLVGGIVRDQWLDRPLGAKSDIDLTTDAHPTEIKRLVAPIATDLWTQGERFGTIGLRVEGRAYEITTHRAEHYSADSRKPDVSFGDDITVDLSRRDFTVNAMAIELPDGDLVDPYGGAVDLQERRLRTPLDADISFSDDPLRMLRAARFAAKYELEPDPGVVASAERLHERLRIVAIERIGVELYRLLEIGDVGTGLRLLATTGLLSEVLGYDHEPARLASRQRLDAVVRVASSLPPGRHRRLAGMGLAAFDDPDGVRALCRRLRLSRHDEQLTTRLARSAAAALAVDPESEIPIEVVRRWRFDCASPEEAAWALEIAGAVASEGDERVAAFRAASEALEVAEDVDDVTFLDGAAVMAALGAGPGPIVGRAQAFLREWYLANGPLDHDQQVALLVEWGAER